MSDFYLFPSYYEWVDFLNWLDLIKGRRSVSYFTDRQVESKKIAAILEAGRWAPSPLNSQPWDFTVLSDKKSIARLIESGEYKKTSKNVPLAIAVVLKPAKINNAGVKRKTLRPEDSFMSVGIAAYSMCLAAQSMGVASHLLTPSYSSARKELKLKKGAKMPIMVALGYEDKKDKRKAGKRKSLKKIVKFQNSPARFGIKDLLEMSLGSGKFGSFAHDDDERMPGV